MTRSDRVGSILACKLIMNVDHERRELKKAFVLKEFTQKSDSQFRRLIENLGVGVVVHGPDTAILFANEVGCHLLGVKFEEAIGKIDTDPHWQFVRENYSKMPKEEFPVNQVLGTRNQMKSQIIGFVNPDANEPVWVLCNAYPEFDKKGDILQVVVNFTDISEQKILKAKLSELHNLFEGAMDQSQTGIGIAEAPSGRLTYLNQTAMLLRGLNHLFPNPHDVVDKFLSVWNMYHLDGIPLKPDEFPIIKAVRLGQKTSKEFIIKQEGYEDRVIWVNAAPIYDKSRKIIAGVIVFLDTTERYRLEQEIKEAKQVAEKASITKSRFLDIAAHELRTPVTAFSLLIQLTQKKLDQGIPIDASLLKKIQYQVDRLNRLVVDLLDVSRLERNIITLDLKEADISQLAEECCEDLKMKFPERKIKFNQPKENFFITIDSVRIYQVLTNLIDNALKYTPRDLDVEVAIKKFSDHVEVQVIDHGPPIPEFLIQELFKPFTRGSGELAEKAGGLGLGLFISRGIVELHGGQIGFRINPDEGKMFYFTIPKDKK